MSHKFKWKKQCDPQFSNQFSIGSLQINKWIIRRHRIYPSCNHNTLFLELVHVCTRYQLIISQILPKFLLLTFAQLFALAELQVDTKFDLAPTTDVSGKCAIYNPTLFQHLIAILVHLKTLRKFLLCHLELQIILISPFNIRHHSCNTLFLWLCANKRNTIIAVTS